MKQQNNPENGDARYIHEYSVDASRKKIQRVIIAFFKMKREEIVARHKKWRGKVCKFDLPAGDKYFPARIFVEKNYLKIVSELPEDTGIEIYGSFVKETDRFVEKLIQVLSKSAS